MVRRNVYLVDPLPNIAPSVKKVLEGVSNKALQVTYIAKPDSLQELMRKLKADIMLGFAVGIVMPVNDTGNHPVLTDYRNTFSQPKARVFDVLAHIQAECKKIKPAAEVPIVMPFLFAFKIEKVQADLVGNSKITSCLACLVSHINGTDKTYARGTITQAFHRHFLKPEDQNYMMKDYIPAFIDQ